MDKQKISVRFYESVDDARLRFAVVISKSGGKFVFCKHKARDTWEVPGGRREIGESIDDTAKRELAEETGAVEFDIKPICVYSVVRSDEQGETESFGKLYFADIRAAEAELHSEIERVVLADGYPDKWTYPDIQPKLMAEAERRGFI